MTEIVEILKSTPNLTWRGIPTSSDEINELIAKGLQYEELERQMKGGSDE